MAACYASDANTADGSENSPPASSHMSKQQVIEQLYNTYSTCSKCHQPELSTVRDTDGHILIKMCATCSEPFGVDPTTSLEALEVMLMGAYQQGLMQIDVDCCGNTDPNLFEWESSNHKGVAVCCLVCDRRSTIAYSPDHTHVASQDECSGPQEAFVCQCGNQDPKLMSGEIDTCVLLRCDMCQELVYKGEDLKESTEYRPSHNDYAVCDCNADCKDKNIVVEENAAGEVEMLYCSACNMCYLPNDPDAFKRRPRRASGSQRTQRNTAGGRKFPLADIAAMVPRLSPTDSPAILKGVFYLAEKNGTAIAPWLTDMLNKDLVPAGVDIVGAYRDYLAGRQSKSAAISVAMGAAGQLASKMILRIPIMQSPVGSTVGRWIGNFLQQLFSARA